MFSFAYLAILFHCHHYRRVLCVYRYSFDGDLTSPTASMLILAYKGTHIPFDLWQGHVFHVLSFVAVMVVVVVVVMLIFVID